MLLIFSHSRARFATKQCMGMEKVCAIHGHEWLVKTAQGRKSGEVRPFRECFKPAIKRDTRPACPAWVARIERRQAVHAPRLAAQLPGAGRSPSPQFPSLASLARYMAASAAVNSLSLLAPSSG